jgi:hypothetical protein
MRSRSIKFAACFGIAVFCAVPGGPASAQETMSAPVALGPGCHFGEIIDSSTADDARRKIEAAGFSAVTGLKKSCDNFWHGQAIQDGQNVNVVLSPAGKVMLEGS